MPAKPRARLEFNGPFHGLNTRTAPTMLEPGYLSPSSNNIIVKAGQVLPRPGYARKDSGTLAGGVSYWQSMYSLDFLANSGASSNSYLVLQTDSGVLATSQFRLYQSGALNSATTLSFTGSPVPASNRATYLKMGKWLVICTGGDVVMTGFENDTTYIGTREAGFAAPTSAPTLSASASGAWGHMTGVFTYRFTFADTTYGYESAPSPESAIVSGSTVGMIVSPGVSLPSGATHYRIYRRRVGAAAVTLADGTQAGDGVGASDTWYMVSELATVASDSGNAQTGAASTITLRAGASGTTDIFKNHYVLLTGGTGAGQSRKITSYNGATKVATVSTNWTTNPVGPADTTYVIVQDNLYDEELTDPVPLNNYRPHNALSFTTRDPRYCAYHRNRAFYAAADSAVWYSELPNPITDTTAFPSGIYVGDDSFFTIPTGKNEYITGLWSYGRVLLVFTNQRVFSVDTDPLPDNLPIITEILGATGCISFWTIQESPAQAGEPGVLYWLSREGIQRFNGAQTQTVTKDALDYFFKSITTRNDLTRASAIMDNDRLLYIVSCGSAGSTHPATHIAYSIPDNAATTWTGGFDAYCWVKTYEDQNDQRETIMFANSEAKLWRLDSEHNLATRNYRDDTTDITCVFKTLASNLGLPNRRKHIDNVRVAFGTAPDGGGTMPTSITMGVYANESATSTPAIASTTPYTGTSAVFIKQAGFVADKVALLAQWNVTTNGAGYAPIVGYEINGVEEGRVP